MTAVHSSLADALRDRYTFERELGQGGMATVYLAQDLRHHRPVALKVLHPELAAGLSPERFLREIRTAARLQHPHILGVHDSGEADGLLWYTMPFVEGESLRDRVAREVRLPFDQVARLTREVAEALTYAQGRGVVHRDVKPENILLSQGHALLADFGIAKVAARADEHTMTQVGLVLGTPAYMSPEQAMGDPRVDHRSDIYSLGCVVYELLAGSPPFLANSVMAVLVKHLTQEPPPLPSELPDGAKIAVLGALAKEPSGRFATASAFADALEQSATVAVGRPRPAHTLLVLDFMNVSGDPGVGWLGTGIAETLTIDLQKTGRLRVIGRDRVAKALAPSGDPLAIGASTGADWVVTGSFQVAADRVRITPRLIAVATGELVGMDKVDGRLDDVFALQDRVVAKVVETLAEALSPTELTRIARPPTHTLTAYEHFARGRQRFVQFTKTGFEQARVHYEHAIAADPSYALAYSGLGSILAYGYIATARREDLHEAIRYLERARELDRELADPHLWLAYAYTRSGRFEEAERAARQAVEQMPNDPLAHYLLGGARQARAATECRWELNAAAIPSYAKALALQPLYEPTYLNLGWMYELNGQYGPAERLLGLAVKIEESAAGKEVRFVGALTLLAMLKLRQGRPDDAEPLLVSALDRYSRDDHVYAPVFTALSWYAFGDLARRRGAHDVAVERLDRARASCGSHAESLGIGYYLARAHLGLAKVFRALRMRREEAAAFSAAKELLAERRGYSFDFVWEGGDAQAYADLAGYHAAVGNEHEALTALGRAIGCGWRDLPGLASGDLALLPRTPALEEMLARAHWYAELPEPESLGVRLS